MNDSENTNEFYETIHGFIKAKLIGISWEIYTGFPVTHSTLYKAYIQFNINKILKYLSKMPDISNPDK